MPFYMLSVSDMSRKPLTPKMYVPGMAILHTENSKKRLVAWLIGLSVKK
jgi:hypothetical protein